MKPVLSFEDLRFFGTVARSSTLAAAARTLDVTPPAISQRLQQLEARLSLRLMDRSTRRLILTEEGELLVERAGYVLAEMENIEDLLAARRGTVTGHLRVAAPFGFGRRFVAPVIGRFREENPDVTVALILSDSPTRQSEETFDLAVHIGSLKDMDLVAHKLAPNDRVICAAPSYLYRRGLPSSPLDLRSHDCAVIRENDEDVMLWQFFDADKELSAIRVNPAMVCNDGDVIHCWALAGSGIVVRSEWSVADDLNSGRLVRLLPDWKLPTADVVALVRSRNQRTARTVRFLSMLRESLATPPWRR